MLLITLGTDFVFKLLCDASVKSEAGAGLNVGADDWVGVLGVVGPNPGGRIFTMVGLGNRGSPCGPP